ncbi:MAG: nucleotidyltransferase [Planctomycetota bacterium]|nr:MAG: nucleotidyltransferase [Planctomycetota bacterium]
MLHDPSEFGPRRILPVGTKVVIRAGQSRAGAVGVIVNSPVDPFHAYRIKLVDDTEQSFRRAEFAVLKEMQSTGLHSPTQPAPTISLDSHVIFRCVIGSRAYGLEHGESDTDVRGVFLPPADAHWSLFGVPEQLESDETQECYWELQKFLTLALKANPNILECLYTPDVLEVAPIAQELLDMRSAFLSRLIYQTYNGYVLSQFKRLEQDMRAQGALRWKHAMHLIRLLLGGIIALRDGHVPVRVEEHREELLAINRGEIAWKQVNAWRLRLHADFEAAYTRTKLPERPDYNRANKLLIKARRWRAEHGG